MKLVSRWHFHSIATFGEEGAEYLTACEYLSSPMPYIDETDKDAVREEMAERRRMINTQVRFYDNGELYMLMPLPEGVSKEEVDAAVEEGEISVIDGMMYDAPLKWEDRGGEIWYDSGIEGESCGEAMDPWVKAVDENGFFNFMNIRFEKE